MNMEVKMIAYYAALLVVLLLLFCACSERTAIAEKAMPPLPPMAPRSSFKGVAPAITATTNILRIECDEVLTNLPVLRIVWLESSSNSITWNKLTSITNNPLWVTNPFGTKRTHTWITTNTAPAMMFRAGGVGW